MVAPFQSTRINQPVLLPLLLPPTTYFFYDTTSTTTTTIRPVLDTPEAVQTLRHQEHLLQRGAIVRLGSS